MIELSNSIIINDNCEKVLSQIPDKSIDLIITSPPYNKRNSAGKLVPEIKYEDYSDNVDEEGYQQWQISIINELYRVLKDDGFLFYNHKVRYHNNQMLHPITFLTRTKFILWQEIIWNRKIAGNIRGWRFYNIEERIYWMVKQKPPELPQHIASWSNIWEIPPAANKTIHPAPFTEELVHRMFIIAESYKNGTLTVLDPFAGICTVGLVAKKRGHKYICIEITKSYCEYGDAMINNSSKILRLF